MYMSTLVFIAQIHLERRMKNKGICIKKAVYILKFVVPFYFITAEYIFSDMDT